MTAHPPAPGGIVQPNFLGVEEIIGNVTFPISKKDLLDQVGDATAVVHGQNIDLHELIKDLPDDFFTTEDEFRDALEMQYSRPGDEGESPQSARDPALTQGPIEHLDRDRAQFFEPE